MSSVNRHFVNREAVTAKRAKALICEQGGDYYRLYLELSEDDQEQIATAVANLISVCHNMGPKSALELLVQLGVFFSKNNAAIEQRI